MNDNIRGLIERIEAAGEGSRELDALIHFTVNGKWIGRVPCWPPERVYRPAMETGLYMVIESKNYMYGDSVPLYTASLDAAMSLAGRGRHLAFDVHFMPEEDVVRYRGYHFEPDWDKWNPHDMEWLNRDGSDNPLCAAPALALCAARLRAHKGNHHG